MATKDYGWNGSTLSFGVGVVPLTDLRHADDPATFQTTGSTDSQHTNGAGLPKNSFTASFLGSQVPAAGTVASLTAVLHNDSANQTYTYTKAILSQVSVSGRKDGRIEGSLTAVPGNDTLTAATITSGTIGDLGFNGSTFSFAGAAAVAMVSAQYQASAATPESVGVDGTDTVYSVGIPDATLTITCLGKPQYTIKAKGASAMGWNDGGTIGTGDHWECVAIHDGGSLDGQVTTEHVFKPCRSTESNS